MLTVTISTLLPIIGKTSNYNIEASWCQFHSMQLQNKMKSAKL